MMFCSPIILYDYPKIAPESAGDFFDGTEMDEMLTLRVLTLTDAEKQEMQNGDPRARRILERTEALTNDAMLKAHPADPRFELLRAVAAFLANVPPPLAAAYRGQWASDYAARTLWDAGDRPGPDGASGN